MERNKRWKSKWIWIKPVDPTALLDGHETVYFRKPFTVSAADASLTVHVSADSRYRLFVNGHSVTAGPCKGDAFTHYYETIDVSAYLRVGSNVISAQVIHYGRHQPLLMGEAGPVSVMRSQQGGFLLEGTLQDAAGGVLAELDTNESWVCLRDEAIRHLPGLMGRQYVGFPETVDGNKLPHGWQLPEYSDSGWQSAVAVSETVHNVTGEQTPWFLMPRQIPLLFEDKQLFAGITRQEGITRAEAERLLSEQKLSLAPGQRILVELEAPELLTAYLRIELAGGAGSSVRLLSSECYEQPLEPGRQRSKGKRDEAEGNDLYGDTDTYYAAGVGKAPEQAAEGTDMGSDEWTDGRPEAYEPFAFRTFRYVRLEIAAGEQPLTITSLHFRRTGYPLQVTASFQCSEPAYTPLWDISLNTLQNCMHETYEDCPFYEQLQYTMDTMMQAVFTYYTSADERLGRKAIYDFHCSMLPNGMLQSRYPSIFPQVIPGFSLFWIFMLRDHYQHFKDEALVIRYRPSMEQVLNWFDRQLDDTGIVGPAPEGYWSFVDWVKEWIHLWGVPTASEQGPITVYSLMYIAALDIAAELNEQTGRPAIGAEYRERAERVRSAVLAQCWSQERKLFRDGPGVEEYSQHGQIWAVLSRTVQGEAAAALIESALQDESLAQLSFAMNYFMFQALAQVGRYERSFERWGQWTGQVQLGLTTWLEDPVTQRSDCHAWGAIPLYEFPAQILGVQPASPGFDAIIIAPQIGELEWAKGTVPTRHGLVTVDWQRNEQGEFRLAVTAPAGIPVDVRLPSGERLACPDASGELVATCMLPSAAACLQE